jgi:hypothetical protein
MQLMKPFSEWANCNLRAVTTYCNSWSSVRSVRRQKIGRYVPRGRWYYSLVSSPAVSREQYQLLHLTIRFVQTASIRQSTLQFRHILQIWSLFHKGLPISSTRLSSSHLLKDLPSTDYTLESHIAILPLHSAAFLQETEPSRIRRLKPLRSPSYYSARSNSWAHPIFDLII